MNFLDLPPELTSFSEAEVAILGIPYEATTTYGKGTQAGPLAIIEASSQVETYDEELRRETCNVGITTKMMSDTFGETAEGTIELISGAVCDLINRKKFVIGLGGEHAVSVGLVQAHKEFYPQMWVLQLDAHSDLRDEYLGSRMNHACTMARIQEICPFAGIGIRSGIRGEEKLIAQPSKMWYAYEMRRSTDWMEAVLATLGDPVYITIDLDFFDPSIMPSVGTPEPGGFHWYETLDFLRRVARERRIVGFDVVELAPQPTQVAPDFLAAKLVYKLIGYVFEERLAARSQENS